MIRLSLFAARAPGFALLLGAASLDGMAQASLPPPTASPSPVVGLEYDAMGQPTRRIAAPTTLPLARTQSWDRLGRLASSSDAPGLSVELGYTGAVGLGQVMDPRGLVTRYSRNGFGDLLGLASPDTGIERQVRDAAGNLVSRTDSRGAVATYRYDALSRLTGATHVLHDQSLVFAWNYDQTGPGFSHGIGRLTSTEFPGGSQRFSYDGHGRLRSSVQTVAGGVTLTLGVGYTYDPAGNVTSITYPSGRVLQVPHAGGLPVAMSLSSGSGGAALPLVSALEFQPGVGSGGEARAWNWELNGGRLPHRRVFDLHGRMVRHPLGGAVRDIVYDTSDRISRYIHFDALTGAPVPGLDQMFQYDSSDRLTQVTTAVGRWAIGYDGNGNRTISSATTAGRTVSRNHAIDPASNRLLAIDNPSRTFVYDAAGNTVNDGEAASRMTSTMDPQGRVARVSRDIDAPGYTTRTWTRYGYDARGLRVVKEYMGGTTCWGVPGTVQQCALAMVVAHQGVVTVHDPAGRILGEYRLDNGSVIREYAWLGDMPVAVIDGPASAPTVYYVQTDHLNTPRVLIDRAGRQRWSWVAEPFGNSSPIENPLGLGPVKFHLRMPGQYFDEESGQVYNWHRNYDAGTGRYTQSDPIGLQGGINTYAYVGGNPVSRIDPDGRLFFVPPLVWWGVGAIGVGGAAWWATTTPPKMLLPSAPAAPYCKVDEFDKKTCDDNFERDQDACYEQFGNGLKGGGFASNLRGCLAWAEVRRNACYRGERDPGPYGGGDSWPGGRNR